MSKHFWQAIRANAIMALIPLAAALIASAVLAPRYALPALIVYVIGVILLSVFQVFLKRDGRPQRDK